MANRLGQQDFEDLSAYLDGELDAARRAEVERLLRDDPVWQRAHRELAAVDGALDACTVPAPPSGLAQRIVARAHSSRPGERLTDVEREDLSAYLDDELDAARRGEVERRVEAQPAWRRAHRELTAVDAALDSYTAPAPPAGLADRVLAHTRRSVRRRQVLRVVGWVAPVAAAAAILLIVFAVLSGPGETALPPGSPIVHTPPGELEASQAYQDVPETERAQMEEVIIQHLSFFRNYEVLEEFETLEAIDRLENEGT